MKSKRKLHIAHEVKSGETKQILTVIFLWIGVSVLAVIIALAVGNTLGNSVDGIYGDVELPPTAYEYTPKDVPPVDAWYISLAGQTLEKLGEKLDSLPRSVKAVSVYLRSGSGAPAYSSQVYSAVTGNACPGISLTDAVALLHQRGFYVSGCFDIGSPQLAGNAGNSALLDFEASLISEAAASGIDEIILNGLPSGKSGISSASSVFKRVRAKHPDILLGAGISHNIMLSDAGAEALLSYSEFADFCAVDTSGASATGSSAVSIVGQLKYVFEKYPIRLLFEFSGNSDRISQAEKLYRLGVVNIQSHKQAVTGSPSG